MTNPYEQTIRQLATMANANPFYGFVHPRPTWDRYGAAQKPLPARKYVLPDGVLPLQANEVIEPGWVYTPKSFEFDPITPFRATSGPGVNLFTLPTGFMITDIFAFAHLHRTDIGVPGCQINIAANGVEWTLTHNAATFNNNLGGNVDRNAGFSGPNGTRHWRTSIPAIPLRATTSPKFIAVEDVQISGWCTVSTPLVDLTKSRLFMVIMVAGDSPPIIDGDGNIIAGQALSPESAGIAYRWVRAFKGE
jgi:hypothetical protein